MNAALLALALTLLPAAAPATAGTTTPLPKFQPRFGRTQPVIAVLGYNAATEVTDYVVPYGILAEARIADVVALSTEPGPIQMRPALRFQVHATIDEFDARYADGADYVIVPNIYEGANDPRVLEWVRSQSRRGATIVGICDGVPVLANAGLLAGRRATGHWRSIDGLERKHRDTRWIRNRRYIADGKVITTSGVTASIPVSMALIEAIGGRARAEEVAATLGITGWTDVHDSLQFRLGAKLVTAVLNKTMFWRHEQLGVRAAAGVDEIALSIAADTWSRTRRSWTYSVAASAEPIVTRRGLTLLPDRQLASGGQLTMLPSVDDLPATHALDRALTGIEQRYGGRTAALVAVQIEYAWDR